MKQDFDQHLPLSAAAIHILLSLASEDRHGYGIMREVAGVFSETSEVTKRLKGVESLFMGQTQSLALDQAAAAITASGGKLILPKTCINGVGWIIQFLDTEGNIVCAMQYDDKAE